jgi:hypothetical protein
MESIRGGGKGGERWGEESLLRRGTMKRSVR